MECFLDAKVWVVFEIDGRIEPMCFHHWNLFWSAKYSEMGKWQSFDSIEEALVGQLLCE